MPHVNWTGLLGLSLVYLVVVLAWRLHALVLDPPARARPAAFSAYFFLTPAFGLLLAPSC